MSEQETMLKGSTMALARLLRSAAKLLWAFSWNHADGKNEMQASANATTGARRAGESATAAPQYVQNGANIQLAKHSLQQSLLGLTVHEPALENSFLNLFSLVKLQ